MKIACGTVVIAKAGTSEFVDISEKLKDDVVLDDAPIDVDTDEDVNGVEFEHVLLSKGTLS